MGPLFPRLAWPWGGGGALFELNLNNAGAKMWALFESSLGHHLCQAWGLWPDNSVNRYHM